MEVWSVKLLGAVCLLLFALTFGALPFLITKCMLHEPIRSGTDINNAAGRRHSLAGRTRSLISYLNAFAGGVFLATSLLHLMPEVRENTERLLELYEIPTEYPIAELVIGVGLFLVMLVENTAMSLSHSRQGASRQGASKDDEPAAANVHGYQNLKDNGSVKPHEGATNTVLEAYNIEETSPLIPSPKTDTKPPKCYGASSTCSQIHGSCELSRSVQIAPEGEVEVSQVTQAESEEGHQHLLNNVHGLRAVVLLLSLSLHTLFEGLALGLQSKTSEVVSLLVAISVHKSVISFSMSLQFLEHVHSTRRSAVFILMFALMAPAGIVIGMFLSEVKSTALDIVNVSLQGLATGTFLYITFFEVLFKEFGKHHSTLKVLVVILGFSCMATVQIFHQD
jgi:zinc transporter 1/2/3